MYLLGDYQGDDYKKCEEEESENKSECNTPIELLDAGQFYVRCNTYIDGLQPSFKEPIAKAIGKDFEFNPKDIGSVVLARFKDRTFLKSVI